MGVRVGVPAHGMGNWGGHERAAQTSMLAQDLVKGLAGVVWAPWLFLGLFALGSFLLLWRLEAMSHRGFEGTILGALVMPYCSGLGNLIFVFVMLQEQGPGAEVITNAYVNNLTNLTLLVGLPAWLWGLKLDPACSDTAAQRRLSVLTTLAAGFVFTIVAWMQGKDGWIVRGEGLALVSLFLAWQGWHVWEVLRENQRQEGRLLGWVLLFDLVCLAAGAWLSYVSIQWLVHWILSRTEGWLSAPYLGWLSGWLLVLPNAVLALYYAWHGRSEVVYASQVGDGHICIPLCVGLYACIRPLPTPGVFGTAMAALCLAFLLHLVAVWRANGLPRWLGLLMVLGYLVCVQHGLPQ
ncbi:MAG: sodium:calcium symporter [Verrucomicrobiota bacterium]|nr:sodium:calcium symporter [Limisphaera sp.]MDW8381926.1 sodium:calcium symporter [Verrucomicrobiota bacterium]